MAVEDRMKENSQEHFYKSFNDKCTDAYMELHKELTTLIHYIRKNTEPDLKLQKIINKFESIQSVVMQKTNLKKKDHKLFADEYLDICSKLSNYVGKSKCINARIASFNEFLKKSEHLNLFASIEREYEYEGAKEAVGVVAPKYFIASYQKTKEVAEQIEATEKNIEFLKKQIENAILRLESINELSQFMKKSKLNEDNDMVKQEDLDNAKAILKKIMNKGKESDRKLKDYCKKENIKMSNVDKIISKNNSSVKKQKTVDIEIKELESELTQLLSERVGKMKKELQDKRKLLIEKKVRESALELKHKNIVDEIRSFDSKENNH